MVVVVVVSLVSEINNKMSPGPDPSPFRSRARGTGGTPIVEPTTCPPVGVEVVKLVFHQERRRLEPEANAASAVANHVEQSCLLPLAKSASASYNAVAQIASCFFFFNYQQESERASVELGNHQSGGWWGFRHE